MTYEQAFADHQYLWKTHGPAYDMTGGYVDQNDLGKMLRRPTKGQARECLCDQIRYWFEVGCADNKMTSPPFHDPEVSKIAERHGIYIKGAME